MLPNTVVGLIVLVVAVLPGALLIWGYERQAGAFGISAGDRVLRFMGASAIVHAVAAPAEYLLYRKILKGISELQTGPFFVLWFSVIVVAVISYSVGTILGGLHRTKADRDRRWTRVRRWLSEPGEQRLLRLAFGPDPAPRAWDRLFSERPSAYLRVKLVDGTWVAGLFAEDSHAGGHPNPTDLLLEDAWRIDAAGNLMGSAGLGYRLYLPAERIQWIELIPEANAETGEP